MNNPIKIASQVGPMELAALAAIVLFFCNPVQVEGRTYFQQNVVSNGTFDANAGSWIGANIAGQGGWTATGGNPDGHFVLDSTGDATTDPRLCQTLTGLIGGRVFEITGDYASFQPASGDPSKVDAFAATIDGVPVLELSRPSAPTTWTPFSRQFVASDATATLCFLAERDGDDSSFRIDNISVIRQQLIIVVTPSAPVAGGALDLEATLPSGLPVDQLEVFYRMSGESTYASSTFTIGSTTGDVSIPANAITSRGLDYYLVLTSGQGVTTVPQTDPQNNPIRIRVAVAQQTGPSLRAELQYQMVSVPLQLSDATTSAVFEDDYGRYDAEDWRLFRWDAGGASGAGTYEEGPNIAMPVAPGVAFWLAHRNATSFDVDNGLSVDASQPFEIVLAPGWNQIGTPFDFPVAWSSVVNSDQVQEPVAYDGVEYIYQQATLLPWAGYFVFSPGVAPVSLFVPPTASTASPVAAPKQATGDAGGGSWSVEIVGTVEGSGLRDSHNVIGFDDHVGAPGVRGNVREAPGIGDHLRVSIVEDGIRYARHLKQRTDEGAYWDVEVELVAPSDLVRAKRNVRIDFTAAMNTSHGAFDFTVVDRETGSSYTHGGPVTLRLAPLDRPASLRVIAGTPAYINHAITEAVATAGQAALRPGYPNPFLTEIRMEYTLEAHESVNLSVYDVLGRRVRLLERDEKSPGAYTVSWDGRADSGARVAGGVYFVRMRTAGFTAVRDIVLVR